MIKYIGKNTAGEQIFLNPNHVVALIANPKGTKPIQVYVTTGLGYEIMEDLDTIRQNLILK